MEKVTSYFKKVLKGKESIIDEWYETDLVDFLLKRDWFLDVDDILEVVNLADQDAWNYIYKNRTSYSNRIRHVIEYRDFLVHPSKLTMRCVDYTDDMYTRRNADILARQKQAFEKSWEIYSATLPERCLESIDSQLDDVWRDLQLAKDNLKNYNEKKPKKYVPPSMRGKEVPDEMQVKLTNAITELETDFNTITKAVADADKSYTDNKKDEYHSYWVSTMQAEDYI
jgi:hypothetical protein